MTFQSKSFALRVAALTGLLALAGCGGGGGGSGTTTGDGSGAVTTSATRGSVALFLTDAPADPSLFEEVNIRLTDVRLVPEDGAPVQVRDAAPVTVDLLDLTHEAIPLSYREGVPEGRYCRIELGVESVELVLAAGGSVFPDLPAGGTLTLVPEDCFEVTGDAVAHVQLDLDVGKSIRDEGGTFVLQPVFFVDVIPAGGPSRLLRLEGEIADVDPATDRVLLCGSVPIFRHDHANAHQACAWIQVTRDTGLFDNISEGGAAQPLSALFDPTALGLGTTVVGVVDRFGHGFLDLDVPAGQLPPPGECKLWFPERPAGQQPPPEPCDTLVRTAPVDTVVIDHDGVILLDRRGLLTVNAVAVELGDFAQVDGTAVDPAVAGEFTMEVRPGEIIAEGLVVPVTLQDAPPGGNGTRIVSKSGEPLAAADIDPTESLSVDGIITGGPGLLSTLVIVDDTLVVLERLSGTVISAGPGSALVEAASAGDNPCADAVADLLVAIGADTSFLTVTITDTSSTTSIGGTLSPGQNVDIFGVCTPGGSLDFNAAQVVIVDDQRTL